MGWVVGLKVSTKWGTDHTLRVEYYLETLSQ